MLNLDLRTNNHKGNKRTKDINVEDYMLAEHAAVVLTFGRGIIYTATHMEDVLREVNEKGYLMIHECPGVWAPIKLGLVDIKEIASPEDAHNFEKKQKIESMFHEDERYRKKFELDHARWCKALGKVLKGLRLNKGWSMEKLARETPLKKDDIKAYESGEREIGHARLQTYAAVFDTTINKIMSSVKWRER